MKLLFWFIAFIISISAVYRLILFYKFPHLSVTSWWRSVKHNKEVGGITSSWHLFGLAFDVTNYNYLDKKNLARFFKVIDEQTHLHLNIL
jgi:inhibitor of KinA sporulation pathway (predicted exonuclease)